MAGIRTCAYCVYPRVKNWGSRLSLWRPAPQEKLLLCVNVAGPGWASPEKRSRPAHGWKGRPRSWQRGARWYQAFCFFFAGTRRSLVPRTKTKTIFFHTKTKISRTHTDTDGFFFGDVPVSIRNSLRSNYLEVRWLACIPASCDLVVILRPDRTVRRKSVT